MTESKEKLRVIAEDCKAVIEEAKSMGCNKVRALYNIPLGNMELIVQALEKPTVYDVDKVVKDLETDVSVKLYGSGNSDNYLIPVKRAVEIARKGGITDD